MIARASSPVGSGLKGGLRRRFISHGPTRRFKGIAPRSAYSWGDPLPRRFDRVRMLAFLVGWAGVVVLAVAGLHQIIGGGR